MTIQELSMKIKSHQIKMELILTALIFVGIILRNSEMGKQLTIISLSTLSLVYFMMLFRTEKANSRFFIVINKINNLSFCIGITGLLYTINNYPYAELILRTGLLSIIFGLIGLLFIKIQNKGEKKNIDSDLIRTFVIALIIAGLMAFGNLSDLRPLNPDNSVEKQELIEKR